MSDDIPVILLDWDYETYDIIDDGGIRIYGEKAPLVKIEGWLWPGSGYMEPTLYERHEDGYYHKVIVS